MLCQYYDAYNVISYGVGVNSTAMIAGMYMSDIPIGKILFADTGAEMPHTYEYIPVMQEWLHQKGLPPIEIVEKFDRDGYRLTLEDECFKSETMPSLAYGWRKCSVKHKKAVQDKYCNHCGECMETWAAGQKVNRFIGYDAREKRRVLNALQYDDKDAKYNYAYPLFTDWGWDREECKRQIIRAGIKVPKKSSCYFCPGMKKHEIQSLWEDYPAHFEKAVTIERLGLKTARTVKGLGRNFSWEKYQQETLAADSTGNTEKPGAA